MFQMHYRHPHIGLAFDMPDEWELDDADMSRAGFMLAMRLGETRLMLQIQPSQGSAPVRLAAMQQQLEAARAAYIGPCPAPQFGRSRDIVALRFFIAGSQQRWLSISHEGHDYTISHSDDWQDVAAAVDRMCASFIFPPADRLRHALRVTHGASPRTAAPAMPYQPRHRDPAMWTGWLQRVGERLRRAHTTRTQG
ncbi:hypothetical protein CAL12_13085 [Bordetella genomosp. 8]|uniref:Uncharacterized protein n=2 Tax=Bordetella genomosp. 8 TaxID=1416806 RepID=A0A1W6YKV1_9BORD|nr:hypothetical protein CAL12_13085 [Bordetella genomosp. 8]